MFVVMSAEADIQGLNGIARFARDLKSIIAGGSAPAPWVSFLCTSKERNPPAVRGTASKYAAEGGSTKMSIGGLRQKPPNPPYI